MANVGKRTFGHEHSDAFSIVATQTMNCKKLTRKPDKDSNTASATNKGPIYKLF